MRRKWRKTNSWGTGFWTAIAVTGIAVSCAGDGDFIQAEANACLDAQCSTWVQQATEDVIDAVPEEDISAALSLVSDDPDAATNDLAVALFSLVLDRLAAHVPEDPDAETSALARSRDALDGDDELAIILNTARTAECLGLLKDATKSTLARLSCVNYAVLSTAEKQAGSTAKALANWLAATAKKIGQKTQNGLCLLTPMKTIVCCCETAPGMFVKGSCSSCPASKQQLCVEACNPADIVNSCDGFTSCKPTGATKGFCDNKGDACDQGNGGAGGAPAPGSSGAAG